MRQGLCTRTNANGRYDFVRLMRTGKYLAYAPMNNVDDPSSQTALDHTRRAFNVLTTVGQQSNLDLALVRFGAIVGTLRTPDPANGTDFIAVDGVTITATYCEPSRGRPPLRVPADVAGVRAADRAGLVGTNGTYRIDRLTPPGLDPETNLSISSYRVVFHKDGYADQVQVVTAPALNEERQLDVVMLPQPTQVVVTPYWTNADNAHARSCRTAPVSP